MLSDGCRPLPAAHPGAHDLQRYFSTFPGSWPGAGLLLLRGVVGGAVAIQGGLVLSTIVSATAAPTIPAAALGALAIASGTALIVGIVTPCASAAAALTTILMALVSPRLSGPDLLMDKVAVLFVLADAGALLLLGPGAHSLDARLFGRREIVIPHHPSPR